ncbi:MAG: hypothetical protein MJ238_03415 [Bacilli bacterium]|nr:hypothetical protein [Bacilli bacterium]
MAKLTRKSYKRKKITFAAVLLAGIALVSTGFAAWVLSNNVSKDGTGNIKVGKVSDSSITMTVEKSANDFKFDPAENDNTGRVRWDGTNFENLSVDFTITCEAATPVLADVKVNMAKVAAIDSAIANNYIVAPACYGADVVIPVADMSKVEDEGKTTWTKTYTVAFTWGSAFDNKNPSIYYDTEYPDDSAKGKGVAMETVKNTLDAFYEGLGSEAGTNYTITFTAELN